MMDGDSAGETQCDDADDVVRGRVKRDGRPTTFNQLWTAEEQRRLEQLLLEYPPEEVEARRWDKIARALSNRTAQQVRPGDRTFCNSLLPPGVYFPQINISICTGKDKCLPHESHVRNGDTFKIRAELIDRGPTPGIF